MCDCDCVFIDMTLRLRQARCDYRGAKAMLGLANKFTVTALGPGVLWSKREAMAHLNEVRARLIRIMRVAEYYLYTDL